MKMLEKIIKILLPIFVILCMIELAFIRGLFTGIIGCIILGIITLIQIAINVKNKEYYGALITLLLCISIYIGYYVVINF